MPSIMRDVAYFSIAELTWLVILSTDMVPLSLFLIELVVARWPRRRIRRGLTGISFKACVDLA
jgi:hypothetical protein